MRGHALGGCVAWEVWVGSQGPSEGGGGLRDQFLLFFLNLLKISFFFFIFAFLLSLAYLFLNYFSCTSQHVGSWFPRPLHWKAES